MRLSWRSMCPSSSPRACSSPCDESPILPGVAAPVSRHKMRLRTMADAVRKRIPRYAVCWCCIVNLNLVLTSLSNGECDCVCGYRIYCAHAARYRGSLALDQARLMPGTLPPRPKLSEFLAAFKRFLQLLHDILFVYRPPAPIQQCFLHQAPPISCPSTSLHLAIWPAFARASCGLWNGLSSKPQNPTADESSSTCHEP